MKKYSLLQKKVDYDYYLQLKENGVLPLLITFDENDTFQFVDELYTFCHLSHEIKERIYELNLYSLCKLIQKKEIEVKGLVMLDEVSYNIEKIMPGSSLIEKGGFDIKFIGIRKQDTLNKEIIESEKVKTKVK